MARGEAALRSGAKLGYPEPANAGISRLAAGTPVLADERER
jgi:hypothetical protein